MAMDLSVDFLQRRAANFRPMTPIQFLRRAADVFPDRTAVVHGDIKYTWLEHDRRCRLLASALTRSGTESGPRLAGHMSAYEGFFPPRYSVRSARMA